MKAHEIDYRIFGSDMQFVEIELDPQETVMAEPEAMMIMNDAVEMNTIFGNKGVFYDHKQSPVAFWIQSLPFSRLANRIIASAPKSGKKQRGESTILGGLGDLLDGDNRF